MTKAAFQSTGVRYSLAPLNRRDAGYQFTVSQMDGPQARTALRIFQDKGATPTLVTQDDDGANALQFHILNRNHAAIMIETLRELGRAGMGFAAGIETERNKLAQVAGKLPVHDTTPAVPEYRRLMWAANG